MKFDENVNDLLNKYPLNEDLGNIFGTLGRMVKNAVVDDLKYIAEPTGLVNAYNRAKSDKIKLDKSKGDNIILKSTDNFLKDSNITNKKINFTQNGKPLLPNGFVSYNELQKTKLTGKDPNTNQPVEYNKELRNIIYALDLNELNLIQGNENLIKQQLEKEFKNQKDKSKLKINDVYKRFIELLQKQIFIPKPKDLELKIKWLYILAKPNQAIQASAQNAPRAKPQNTINQPTRIRNTTPVRSVRPRRQRIQ